MLGLNIARFYDSSQAAVNLANWQQPVFVVRESKDGKEVPFRRTSSDAQNLTMQQRQLLRKQTLNARRALTWRVEDAAKKNCFLGNVEGGAAGAYVLFKKEVHTLPYRIQCGRKSKQPFRKEMCFELFRLMIGLTLDENRNLFHSHTKMLKQKWYVSCLSEQCGLCFSS